VLVLDVDDQERSPWHVREIIRTTHPGWAYARRRPGRGEACLAHSPQRRGPRMADVRSGDGPESPDGRRPKAVAPYMAVGLSTVVHGIGERKHIERNLRIVEDAIHAAVSIIGINMPVKLIALAEGALTGFTDEIFDVPHVTAARELFIDLPGAETEHLAGLAKHYETYLVVQCKARWPEVMPDRYFNTLFVISPKG